MAPVRCALCGGIVKDNPQFWERDVCLCEVTKRFP
jgi:hypothetical protein